MDFIVKQEDNAEYVLNIFLENMIDPNGSHITPYYDDPRIAQIEDSLNDPEIYKMMGKPASKFETNTKIISTYEDVITHFENADDKYFVTGYTDSKFDLLSKCFSKAAISNLKNTSSDVKFKEFTGDESGKKIEVIRSQENNNIVRTKIKFMIPGLDISAMILLDDDKTPEYVLYLDTQNPIKYVDFGEGYTIFKYMRSNIEEAETANIIFYDGFIEEPKIISEVFIDRGLNSGFEKMKKLKNVTDLNELNKMGLGYYKINKKGYNFKNI